MNHQILKQTSERTFASTVCQCNLSLTHKYVNDSERVEIHVLRIISHKAITKYRNVCYIIYVFSFVFWLWNCKNKVLDFDTHIIKKSVLVVYHVRTVRNQVHVTSLERSRVWNRTMSLACLEKPLRGRSWTKHFSKIFSLAFRTILSKSN